MIDINNALTLCDTYKTQHVDMYPRELLYLFSYMTPRKSMLKNQDHVVVFGIGAFIEEWLVDYFNRNFFSIDENTLVSTYKYYMDTQLDGKYNIEPMLQLHRYGRLPLEIKALPEGSVVPMGVPIISVTNIHKDFAWVTQWIECIMQAEVWVMCNYATIGHMYLKLAKKWYKKTAEPALDPRNAFSDFGVRGANGFYDGIRCSSAWLLSANKTSTIPAIGWIDKFYDANARDNNIGKGAVSTEHSVLATYLAMGYTERDVMKKFLTETYANTSFSFLTDTRNHEQVVEEFVPSLRKEILEHNGTILLRPDSGDQRTIVPRMVEVFGEKIGRHKNSLGYWELDPHIRVILGDGCTLDTVEAIWTKLEEMGYAANNVIFGIGAFCFKAIFEDGKPVFSTRDTFGFAFKSCAGVVLKDGVEVDIEIHKDPSTDTSNLKKSHKGMVCVTREEGDFVARDGYNRDNFPYSQDLMEVRFCDGHLYNRENNSFMKIRERLDKSKF